MKKKNRKSRTGRPESRNPRLHDNRGRPCVNNEQLELYKELDFADNYGSFSMYKLNRKEFKERVRKFNEMTSPEAVKKSHGVCK